MSSSSNKEETESKKKYAFFSDPDIIVKRAETSAAASQARQFFQLKQQQEKAKNPVAVEALENANLKTLPVNNLVPAYPFTFITAVKRKLVLGENSVTKKSCNPDENAQVNEVEVNEDQSCHKMDFIKPLKVPDLKISPKTLDYSSRDSSSAHEDASRKFVAHTKETLQKDEKTCKNGDRAQRKLDFSMSGASSILNSENIEPLKAPDFSIYPSLVKKKEHSRESLKEKENRSKKQKKDEFTKSLEDPTLDKRSKNTKLNPKKDVIDPMAGKARNERFPSRVTTRENEVPPRKPKNKSFVTSTTRKDEDRRHRYLSKFVREKSLESKNRCTSSDSLSAKSQELYRPTSHEQCFVSRQSDKVNSKQQNRASSKEKAKQSGKSGTTSEISEDVETESNARQSESSSQSKSARSVENSKYREANSASSAPEDSNTKESQEHLLLDALLDSRKISFRDEVFSPQPDFDDLATPDINLFRMKRRKQMLQDEAASKGLKLGKEEETKLLHPTALHMQFQAELNLLDTFNESLRQVTDVENCLYNAQHEHCSNDKDSMQKQRSANDEMKRQLNNAKDSREPDPKDTNFDKDEKSESKINGTKSSKAMKAVEVQTQTANDMATQTELLFYRYNSRENLEELANAIYKQHSDSQESIDQSIDLERLEDVSLPSKMRTMSEISLHETTSSIKTETGTEISISTRDVTCSFNKYLDLEMAQLIKDEKQRYDKIEMLFKSREKTLNDRTKKLVKLEEQKRALRDAGQDSQISSVKKKQRALLLKLQQEKDEMNRLKELHKIASQERKLMLQKQRDMFDPEMSTKNILTKLKRSADNQSPRRLSGPMKGYDIRSNSSMSSLVDSDRSQLERSHLDAAALAPPSSKPEESANVSQEENAKPKYDVRSRSFEEKMPRADILRFKGLLNDEYSKAGQDSEDLVEELLKKSKLSGERKLDVKASSKRKGSRTQKTKVASESVKMKCDAQLLEDLVMRHHGKRSRVDSSDENYQNSILEEVDFNDSQGSLQALLKHSKDVNEKNCRLLHDIANERGAKEAISTKKKAEVRNLGNISTRSQVSTFTISHHSSGESEKSFSQSVVIRGHDPRFKNSKKLEQILNARETALASRRSCVEEWIAWHARLREEENRVARMEEAALKLVSAASKALPYHDTTVSSDTSDVEGRIEKLTKKLADRRLEMTRLKKEARRQAKQRLRALEANLLNQIKKYDTTINEMRKKLETRKSSVKDNEKLAIESRSVTDFKVPEIPIKSVKDIYKNNDLLRSKSEPMLMPAQKMKTVDNEMPNRIIGKFATSESEEMLTQNSELETPVSRSTTSEDIPSEINALDRMRLTKSSEQADTADSSDTPRTENSLIFSRNLTSIQFHNKDLNENISTLENDLKSLSEMMSSFSRRSDQKLKSIRMLSQGSEIPTEISGEQTTETKEITEELTENTGSNGSAIATATSANEIISKSRDSDIEEVLSNSVSRKNTDYEAQSKEILNEIEQSIISESVVKTTSQEPQSSQLAFEVGMQNLYKENEALSKDLNSLEADIESISDMISKVIKSKSSTEQDKRQDTINEQDSVVYDSKTFEVEDSKVTDLIETIIDSLEGSENQETTLMNEKTNGSSEELGLDLKSKLSDEEEESQKTKSVDFYDESAASLQDLKETDIDSSHEFDGLREPQSDNGWTTSDSFEAQKPEKVKDHDSACEIGEISSFVPRGESTMTEKLESKDKSDSVIEEDIEEAETIEEFFEEKASEENGDLARLQNSSGDKDSVVSDEERKPENALNVTFSVEVEKEENLEDFNLPVLEINAKMEVVEGQKESSENAKCGAIEMSKMSAEMAEDRESSEGEQMDNMIEVAESGLETWEKTLQKDKATKKAETKKLERTIDILKESEYSDISEESMEVSEIMEQSETKKRPRAVKLPEKYEATQKSEDVIKILDELSKASRLKVEDQEQKDEISSQSDSSGGGETPRGFSEIEMDSPRDPSDAKNDADAVDEEQAENEVAKKDSKKSEAHSIAVSPSEKDIQAMIDKLKASLEQPGLEVTELEAKLLRIEQLQIELEIKKLEAEEVSYYVREIPNKPPPPYTPPGTGRGPTSQSSPSPPPAVVPTNVDELTTFTEKATLLIFNSKQSGEDIANLEVPNEICELSKDNNEISKRDRRIYNTFLFDLCKEIVSDIYRAEDEKPGPSWTKPDVQARAANNIPRSFEELNECVSKEVALLFGFKTKLQRENMVMRWSRKRRDRVDELLAREAQAEEDEWTKFHHDELTVKNELTVAILDTLLLESSNLVKMVYAKKRKIMV